MFLGFALRDGIQCDDHVERVRECLFPVVETLDEAGDEKHTKIPSIPVGENSRSLYPFKNNYVSLYPYEAWGYSDARVVDAWYLRCNSINLSYVFPEKLVKKFAQSMSVSFMVTNPFQIVSKDFDGRDSEVAKGNQPLSSNYTLNFHVSF